MIQNSISSIPRQVQPLFEHFSCHSLHFGENVFRDGIDCKEEIERGC